MKRVTLICLSLLLATALTLDASAFRGGGGGVVVEVSGAVVPESIEAEAVQVLSAVRAAAVWRGDRLAVLPCVARWAMAPL